LIVVAPLRAVVDGAWISLVLNSHYGLHSLLSIQTGALHPHLNCGDVKDVCIPFPPQSEQSQIAAFLECETAKIDALIAEQQRLIELLNEKRQAVISHAVTKGLNPNAPMKSSGVEWLGDIPANWEITESASHLSIILRVRR
jgi:type I restriction enzyme, S subunit